MNGYTLQKGEYERRNLTEDELWNIVNWFFSSRSKNDSSYKFIFFKSILDCMEEIQEGYHINFDELFERFTEISWNLVLKYNIRQKAITKGKSKTCLEQILHDYKYNYLQGQFILMDALSNFDRIKICRNVKIKCKKYVVGALYGDTNRVFYSFNKKEEWIKINPEVSKFINFNKEIIESLNYCKWAKFYSGINDDVLIDKLEEMIDGSYFKKKESVYRTILSYEFEKNNSFNQKEKSLNTLEMLFDAEEHQKAAEVYSDISYIDVEDELFITFDMMKNYLSDPVLLIKKLKKEKGILV